MDRFSVTFVRSILSGVFVCLAVGAQASAVKSLEQQSSDDILAIMTAQQKIDTLGFGKALAQSKWPKVMQNFKIPDDRFNSMAISQNVVAQDINPIAWNECVFRTDAPECQQFAGGTDFSPYNPSPQIKNDAIQIIATAVLGQTLEYFKVKGHFGQVKGKNNVYAFEIVDAVEGESFQDLDTNSVIFAVKQFRKYVTALLCNQPNPGRVLELMNAFDVGKRFRWDMAWALMGNNLPDAPNKFMGFGAKWRKFSAAMDGLENGGILRLRNAFGGDVGLNPGELAAASAQGAGGAAGGWAKAGFIAKEVVAIIRLAGDIISAILDFFCVSDLSVDAAKEKEKETVIYKLLDVKKKVMDKYGPVRPVLDEMGKKATALTGKEITFLP